MRSLSELQICWTRILINVSLWLALVCPAARAEDEFDAYRGVQTRVVLLRNDRCLTGLVRQLGDQVVIEFDSNSRVSKATSEVLHIANDMEGIYQYKLSKFSQLGVGENMRMARWCLSVGLNEHAAKHFQAVNKTVPDHPLVKQLGVELRDQLLRDPEFREYLGLAKLPAANKQVTAVAAASTDRDVATNPILPAVMSTFAEHVQPILVNRCSQSGCHGFSSSNRFKIIQPLGSSRARITEQNCRSALEFVQVDESKMSTLLRYAIAAHGVQKSPSIQSQEKQLIDYLQSWTTFARNPVMAAVDSSAMRDGSQTQAAYHTEGPRNQNASASGGGPIPLGPNASALRPVPRQPKFGIQGGVQPATGELDALDDQVRRALGEPPRDRTKTDVLPSSSGSSSPKDPFDPALFNQRAGNKKVP